MTIKVTYNVTDVYMSQSVSPVYINVSYSDGGASGGGVWGSITGTLSNQTDLQTALDLKLDESTIDGGTEGQILSKASGTDFDFAWINNYAKYLATNVRNQTGSTINAFQVVYISGATGNKPLISLADADTEATSSKTYGVTATAIANNGTGDVVTAGELSGINTSAFNEGDLLWLSTTAGGVVTSPPAEPAHAVFIGYVVRSHPTLGVIDVAIQNGYELNELHGVQITSAANNDGLFYNSSNSLWENKTISTVLGYTPEQPLTFNSPLSRAGNVVSIPQATGSVNGFLSATDWTTFNSKQAALGYTPANAATTLTINGVTFDLSANRSWTISTGISGSGTINYLAKFTGAGSLGNSILREGTDVISLGIAPNTWTVVKALQIQRSSFSSYSDASFASSQFTTNGYYDGSWRYVGAGGAAQYNQQTNNIAHFWSIAPSGTAGNAITFTQAMTLFNTGSLSIGTTSDIARLGVVGDTLLRGSGATSATTALTVQNSSSTDALKVRNDGVIILGSSTFAGSPSLFPHDRLSPQSLNIAGAGLSFNSPISGQAGTRFSFGSQFTSGNASGTNRQILSEYNITDATGGTATYTNLTLSGTISQTGGSNGITRGLYVNPTLTAAADWRSIEWSNNTGWGLYGSGTANNYLGGNVAIGSTSNTSDWLNIAASTTTKAHIYLAAGVAPTSPANGDIWFDGTDIKMRIGGVTKTFTLV